MIRLRTVAPAVAAAVFLLAGCSDHDGPLAPDPNDTPVYRSNIYYYSGSPSPGLAWNSPTPQ
ncbi:hypothetical protein [Embleya hyalina]|uniref:Lipoprotein n=1 Tax=Embleya hyalina TaxID=516124 RepID=A0A401YXB5_9ACTN|nr:hypothetical protein [Embleya hyalina]GCD99239.1 hypothetical protein EHYA_06953 [Embleya hyalina]